MTHNNLEVIYGSVATIIKEVMTSFAPSWKQYEVDENETLLSISVKVSPITPPLSFRIN